MRLGGCLTFNEGSNSKEIAVNMKIFSIKSKSLTRRQILSKKKQFPFCKIS